MLECLCRGMGDKGIGDVLGISTHGVNFHLRNIFRKLKADCRTLAALRARRYLK